MILTTTPQIEGKQIVEYKQIVFGEVVAGANIVRDYRYYWWAFRRI